MNARAMSLVGIVALAASVALPLPAADPPAADGAITCIVKAVGARNGVVLGKRVLILNASSRYGGRPQQYVVPNADPEAGRIDPDPAMDKVIKAAKAGDFLKVTYTNVRNRMILSKVEACTPEPCEIDPEAYRFLKTTETVVGSATHQAVAVSRQDREQTVLVPNVKNADGETVADPDILAQIAKLAAGDYADAQTAATGRHTLLKWIFPYQAPQSGQFVKLASKRNESGAIESSVTLKADGKPVTVAVRASRTGGPADQVLLAKARSLRANAAVLYKTVEDAGRTWLIDIKSDAQRQSGGDTTMTGTFIWVGKARQINQLKAVLTPIGRGKYKAVYTFTWGGRPKTYIGVITGDLRNGPVTGTGDGDRRNFTFSGTSRNGVMTFRCSEVTRGRAQNQGNGTLRLGG